MARGINKVILLGYIGKDPVKSEIPGGKSVTRITVATTESWKDKSGNKQEKTEWHNVSCFGRLGEIVDQYSAKGDLVYIEGSISTNKWTGKDGKDNYSTNIIASVYQILNARNKQDDAHPQAGSERKGNDAAGYVDNFDDDIPF